MPHEITRRRLVKALGLGTLASTLPMPLAAAGPRKSAIVIGAGISGLAAAGTLRDAGWDVLVLEARNRIGGRINTDRSLGDVLERGANWIHGADGNPLTPLARESGADPVQTDYGDVLAFGPDGAVLPDDALERAEARYENLLERIDARLDEDDDRPLLTALQTEMPRFLDDPVLRALGADTEADTGGRLENLSAYHFDEDKTFDGPDMIPAGGYDRIAGQLARGLTIRFKEPVATIRHGSESASVETETARYQADHVICTVPLGVLKAGAIRFDPPLPARQTKAIGRIGFGHMAKLALTFDAPGWPEDPHFFFHAGAIRATWPSILNLKPLNGRNTLVMICAGEAALKADALSDDAITADAMTTLRRLFGSGLPGPTGIMRSAWSRDPYARGAYSFAAFGSTPADFEALAGPAGPALQLAGEHTTANYRGTVHGAYLSGLRAAGGLLKHKAPAAGSGHKP